MMNKKETREEYEIRKAKREKQEKEKVEHMKEVAKSIIKANECPECHKAQLKRFKHKNYPFGRKSKSVIITGKKCPNCGYIKHNTK